MFELNIYIYIPRSEVNFYTKNMSIMSANEMNHVCKIKMIHKFTRQYRYGFVKMVVSYNKLSNEEKLSYIWRKL